MWKTINIQKYPEEKWYLKTKGHFNYSITEKNTGTYKYSKCDSKRSDKTATLKYFFQFYHTNGATKKSESEFLTSYFCKKRIIIKTCIFWLIQALPLHKLMKRI